MRVPLLDINPPLINTPCPAATTLEDLIALWNCPSTGAITTRTSTRDGFNHDKTKNLYVFYDSSSHTVSPTTNPSPFETAPNQNATLNSLGYSPYPLADYRSFIRTIAKHHPAPNGRRRKTIIISVTGSADDVAHCYREIAFLQLEFMSKFDLAMEVNLSCPNIPGHQPPAYDFDVLKEYITRIRLAAKHDTWTMGYPRVPVGLKTPPYTYETQFANLLRALDVDVDVEGAVPSPMEQDQMMGTDVSREGGSPISFITATNTLGSCLGFADIASGEAALPSESGMGGLAGAPLHPLALGNVKTIRKMLDERKETLGQVQVIGVGGVLDTAGYRRMRKAGADVVGLASGLLLKGVAVFGEIEKGLGDGEDKW